MKEVKRPLKQMSFGLFSKIINDLEEFETKVKAFLNSFENFATDIPDNVVSKVGENVDNLIYSFTGL
jgi:hypothetical protein